MEKFPGKRGIHTWATGIIEKAMVADGVEPNAVPTVLENKLVHLIELLKNLIQLKIMLYSGLQAQSLLN